MFWGWGYRGCFYFLFDYIFYVQLFKRDVRVESEFDVGRFRFIVGFLFRFQLANVFGKFVSKVREQRFQFLGVYVVCVVLLYGVGVSRKGRYYLVRGYLGGFRGNFFFRVSGKKIRSVSYRVVFLYGNFGVIVVFSCGLLRRTYFCFWGQK